MTGKVFVSYARADGAFALKLAQHLRAEGVDLWIDQLDIPAGARWMLVILSSVSVESDSVLDEVGYALDHGKTIVPLLLAACEVPFRLRRLQHIDFTGDFDAAFRRCHAGFETPVAAGRGRGAGGGCAAAHAGHDRGRGRHARAQRDAHLRARQRQDRVVQGRRARRWLWCRRPRSPWVRLWGRKAAATARGRSTRSRSPSRLRWDASR